MRPHQWRKRALVFAGLVFSQSWDNRFLGLYVALSMAYSWRLKKVPVVVFGLLRYTYQMHGGCGEYVACDLLHDGWIVGAGVLWLLIFLSHSFHV